MSLRPRSVSSLIGSLDGEMTVWLVIAAALLLLAALLVSAARALAANARRRRAEADVWDPAVEDPGSAAASAARIRGRRPSAADDPVLAALGLDQPPPAPDDGARRGSTSARRAP